MRELLLAGVKVRAGARNTSKAQEYADLALSFGLLPPSAAKQLQIVPVDMEDEETIVSAIGNAGKVNQQDTNTLIWTLTAQLQSIETSYWCR